MKLKIALVIIGIILVAALGLTSCGGNPAVDVVNKFIEAEDLMFNTGDGSGLMEIEDPNIVIHMMAFPDTVGSEAHVAAIKGIRDANPGITHEWFDVVGTGDTGACRWVEKLKIGDKDVEYQGTYFLEIKDDKIVEAWLISDMLTYFLAAGIVQYAPTPAE